MRQALFMTVAALIALAATNANADLIVTKSGTVDGQAVSAKATFQIVDADTLRIILENTASATQAEAQILTDVDFDVSGGLTFKATGSSVKVGSGSTLFFQSPQAKKKKNTGTRPAGFDVSAEWALQQNITLSPAPGTTFDWGVSATEPNTAVDNSGATTTPLGSPDLGGAGNLDGGDFGLVAPGSHGNGALSNRDVIEKSVEIILKRASGTLALTNITSVAFSYGSLQQGVGVVPEPSSFVLLGLGAIGFGAIGRFRRRPPAGFEQT